MRKNNLRLISLFIAALLAINSVNVPVSATNFEQQKEASLEELISEEAEDIMIESEETSVIEESADISISENEAASLVEESSDIGISESEEIQAETETMNEETDFSQSESFISEEALYDDTNEPVQSYNYTIADKDIIAYSEYYKITREDESFYPVFFGFTYLPKSEFTNYKVLSLEKITINGVEIEDKNIPYYFADGFSYFNDPYQKICLGVPVDGSIAGTATISATFKMNVNDGSGKALSEHIINVTKKVTLKEATNSTFTLPIRLDSYGDEYKYMSPSGTYGESICMDSRAKKIELVGPKGTYELNVVNVFEQKKAYCPEYGFLFAKTPNGTYFRISMEEYTSSYKATGAYDIYNYTLKLTDKIPNGSYTMRITSDDDEQFDIEGIVFKVFGSEAGLKPFAESFGYKVLDAWVDSEGNFELEIPYFSSESIEMSRYSSDVYIDSEQVSYENYITSHSSGGKHVMRISLDGMQADEKEHTIRVDFLNSDGAADEYRLEDTFRIKEVEKVNESTIDAEYTFISNGKDEIKKYVEIEMPVDDFKDRAVKVEAVDSWWSIYDVTPIGIESLYSYNRKLSLYEDQIIDFKGVSKTFTSNDLLWYESDLVSYSSQMSLPVSFEGLSSGKYNLVVTTQYGKKLIIKNALEVLDTEEEGVYGGAYQVDSYFNYVSGSADYIALYVYCGNGLIDGIPSLYLDASLSEDSLAAEYDDSEGSKCTVIPVINGYKEILLKKTAALKQVESENDGTIELFCSYNDNRYLKDYFAYINSDGNTGVKITYNPNILSRVIISNGTAKMGRVYIYNDDGRYAEGDNVNLRAEVYISGRTLVYQTVLQALTDNQGRLYVDIPTNSEFYSKIVTAGSGRMIVSIGGDTYSDYYCVTKVNKLANISVPSGNWRIVNPLDMSDVLLSNADDSSKKTLSVQELNMLSAFPEVILEITTEGAETSSTPIQLTSPVKDTIVYELNGGTVDGTVAEVVFKGATVVLPETPVKEHNTFDGWYLDVNFTKPVTSLTGMGGKTYTVYAKWIQDEYKVIFNSEDDSKRITKVYHWEDKVRFNTSELDSDGRQVTKWKCVNDNSFKPSNTDVYYNLSDISAYFDSNKTCVLMPESYSLISYNITYDLNGAYDNQKAIDEGKLGSNIKYSYTINDEFVPSAPSDISVEGMMFGGWYFDPEFTTPGYINEGSIGDVTFYAKWVPKTYTLKFDVEYDSGKAKITSTKTISDMVLNVGESFVLPVNVYSLAPVDPADRSKYTFLGWKTQKTDPDTGKNIIYNAKQLVCFDSTDIVDNTVTLKAVFAVSGESAYDIYYAADSKPNMPVALQSSIVFPSAGKYYYGDTIKLPVPSAPGYDFAGWIDEATGRKVTSITARDMGDKHLRATWNERKYKISVNVNGGKGRVAVKTVKFTEAYNMSGIANVTKDGYSLASYDAYMPNGTLVANASFEDDYSSLNTDSSLALLSYANDIGALKSGSTITYKLFWKQNTYNINFNCNGGVINDDQKITSAIYNAGAKYQYSTATQALPVPTYEGKVFLGWYSDPECKKLIGKYNSRTKTALLNAKVFGDINLYAKWDCSYKVVLHNNKDTRVISGYKLGTLKPLPRNPFGNISYKRFTGWRLNGVLGEFKYLDSDKVDGTGAAYDETYGCYVLHLYANYVSIGDPTQYTYVWFGNTTDSLYSYTAQISGSMATQKIVIGKTAKLSKNRFSSPLYVFKGWSTSRDSDEVVYKDGDVINSIDADGYYSTHINLYAVWEDKFTITFDKNSSNAVDGSVTEFDYYYGSVVDANAFAKIAVPTRDGYTFGGWFTDAACKRAFKSITKKTAGDFTLYAKWVPKKYTIKYLSGADGTTGRMRDQVGTVGANVKLSRNAYKRVGYDFVGWSIDGNDNVTTVAYTGYPVTDGEAGVVNAVAIWKPQTSTIIYKNVEFATVNGVDTGETVTEFNAADGYVLRNASKLGYAFGGWYTDAKLTKQVKEIKPGKKSSTTVYAKWIKIDGIN